MKDKENQIRKVCGFYANDWHLTTTILPYVRNEIEAENEIITILQNNIKPNIEEILSKMNVNKTLENKILQIDWTKTEPVKYTNIKQKLWKIKGQAKNITILISGEKEFIQIVNQSLQKEIPNANLQNPITIIHFYDMEKLTNGSEMTKEYQYMINTSGIRTIEEVFQKENFKDA